jgi:hypothetical protein
MRRAPLREPYAGASGTAPEHVGTPETVAGKKHRRKRRRSRRNA